jgi:hypothetical protein
MAKANKSSRSTKGAKTAKHTKKNLGKRNNRTRRHRKGAKKGKNMKKGGFINYDSPLTTFDYAQKLRDSMKNDKKAESQIEYILSDFFQGKDEKIYTYTNKYGERISEIFNKSDTNDKTFNELMKRYNNFKDKIATSNYFLKHHDAIVNHLEIKREDQ